MSYYTNLIPDFGLSADQLSDKYRLKGGMEHPDTGFTRFDWRAAAAQANGIAGYWDWLEWRIAEVRDELDRDNPYNPLGST